MIHLRAPGSITDWSAAGEIPSLWEPMSIKEAIDLLFAARERVDFYWSFYVVVVIAVIGWLVTRKEPLTRSTRALVLVAG